LKEREDFIWLEKNWRTDFNFERQDLKKIMKKRMEFGDQEKLKVSLDFAKGLEHLQRLRVIYRHLAARNLFMDKSMTIVIQVTHGRSG
jgi:hypothetical protein